MTSDRLTGACTRKGAYRLARLAAKYGAEIAMPDLLAKLAADCPWIAQAAIGLAHILGIDLIAEGVETERQLELLKSWGCGAAQGFYFAEPMAVEDVTRLLRQGKIDVASRSGRVHRSRRD